MNINGMVVVMGILVSVRIIIIILLHLPHTDVFTNAGIHKISVYMQVLRIGVKEVLLTSCTCASVLR